MKLNIYPEICCEECNEVIHNHFDCPQCKTDYAGTNRHISLDLLDIGDILVCEVCLAKFKLIQTASVEDEFEFEVTHENE